MKNINKNEDIKSLTLKLVNYINTLNEWQPFNTIVNLSYCILIDISDIVYLKNLNEVKLYNECYCRVKSAMYHMREYL